MAERVISKSLAGRQDILFGRGQVTQTRGGGSYPIDKVSTLLVASDYGELALTDTDQFELAFLPDGTLWQFSAGYWQCLNADVFLTGGFAQGCTVSHNKGLVGADTGLFKWTGALPKTVPPSSLPLEPGWQQVNLQFGVFSLSLEEHADDGAASAAGIAIGSLYRTGNAVKVRVV